MFTEQGELFHKEFACGTRISMGTSQEDLLSDDAQAKTEQFNRQVVERVKTSNAALYVDQRFAKHQRHLVIGRGGIDANVGRRAVASVGIGV